MNHITYTTEKLINQMKKDRQYNLLESTVIYVYDKLFSDCSYYGATLKEFESYLGHKLNNSIQINIYEFNGIYGIEYMTNRNARYIGTNDLSYINIDDFNQLVKQAYKEVYN